MRGASHRDIVLIVFLHPHIESPQVADGAVNGTVMHAAAVDKGLFPEQDMSISVVCDLVSLVEHALHKAVIVDNAAAGVLIDVGVVVEADTAPRGGTLAAGLVGVVHGGVADNVEGAFCVELGEGVQY